jgi:hypothetical protein
MRPLLRVALTTSLLLCACGNGSTPTGSTTTSTTTSGSSGTGGAGGTGGSTGSGGSPSPASCAFQTSLGEGVACAIEPSSTHASIVNDFGYHAIGLPKTITAATPVYVHLVGSGGEPAKPANQAFPNQLLMSELTAKGALVILPAYDNDPPVGTLCKSDLDCYEPVRNEILYGEEASGKYAALKDVTPPNDIVSRLGALLAALRGSELLGGDPPAALATVELDTTQLRLGGHSQGGGHVALFAKRFPVARVCMLSAPIDGADIGGVGTAVPWVSGAWATPLEARRAVIHEQDPGFAKAKANFDAMGLVEGTHWTRLTFATGDPHAATVKDAMVSAARAACFE